MVNTTAAPSTKQTVPAASWSLWPNTECKGARAEARLLSRLPFFGNTADATKPSARIEQVPTGVNGSGDYINTLIIEPPAADSTASGDGVTNFVLLHGYATGLGFFYRNYEALASVPNLRVLSIDMPGFGRSSRPSTDFSGRVHPDAPRDRSAPVPDDIRAAAAEDFFVEQLEQWRQRLGLEKMVLAGHSFGGYMSACYAMRYPDRVEKLILISPVGIPPKPDNYDDIIANGFPVESVKKREELVQLLDEQRRENLIRKELGTTTTTESGDEATTSSISSSRPASIRSVSSSSGDKKSKSQQSQQVRRKIPSFFIKLWECGFTPQSIVRWAGPIGPYFASKFVSRWNFLDSNDIEDLRAYVYHITANRGSGEYALSAILMPLAFARTPLEPRLTKPGSLKMPVTFLYGSHDWMDSKAGQRVVDTLTGQQQSADLITIQKAGHNLFLENSVSFNEELTLVLRKHLDNKSAY